MKIKNWLKQLRERSRVITRFGAARLVKTPDGQHELVGGTRSDRADAREWVSLFLHEAVVREK